MVLNIPLAATLWNDHARTMVERNGENSENGPMVERQDEDLGTDTSAMQTATGGRHERLEVEITHVRRRRDQLITGYFICLSLGVLLLVVGSVFLIAYANDIMSVYLILGIATSAPAAGGLVAVPPLKARIRSLEARLLDLTFERDVLHLEPTSSEIRADKLPSSCVTWRSLIA